MFHYNVSVSHSILAILIHSIVPMSIVQCIPAIATEDFIFGYDIVHDNADITIVHSISVIPNVCFVVAIGIVHCISAVAIVHSTAATVTVDSIFGYFIIGSNTAIDHKSFYCYYGLFLIFATASVYSVAMVYFTVSAATVIVHSIAAILHSIDFVAGSNAAIGHKSFYCCYSVCSFCCCCWLLHPYCFCSQLIALTLHLD